MKVTKHFLETAYLVYRPVMMMDEGITPYVVCDTEEEAIYITEELLAWVYVYNRNYDNEGPEIELDAVPFGCIELTYDTGLKPGIKTVKYKPITKWKANNGS